jgi:hypothetical protein
MPTKKPASTQQYSYAQACKTWSVSDHWPLDDAVSLVLGLLPRIVQTGGTKPDIARRHKVLREIALNCTGESLPIINPKAPENQYRVRPREFVKWAEKIIEVPQELKEIIDKAGTHFGKKDAPREWNPKQRHRERCCGIAAMIWARQPDLTKRQMANRAEILEYGCEGRQYTKETIENWIKAEKPSRQGGRPRKLS